jgi:hypothetical protein
MSDPTLELLGKNVEDRVTGAKGLVTSVKIGITGNIQVAIQSKSVDGVAVPDATYCDIHLVTVIDDGVSADITLPVNPTTIPIGAKVRDITGFEGITTNKGVFLNGCEFFIVESIRVDEKSKPTMEWLNANRLTQVDAPVAKVEVKKAENGKVPGGPNERTMARQSVPRV